MPRADIAAQRLRLEFDVADEVLPDLETIAAAKGAEVLYERMASDVSGMLIRERDRIIIGVNATHPPSRQRFTVAHELGHLLLHPGRPLVVDAVRINLRDSRSSLATDLEEIEANAFAAELLMPRALVLRQFRALADAGTDSVKQAIHDLAYGFGVSDQAMEYRLANLGLLQASR